MGAVTVRRLRADEWRELRTIRLAALAEAPSAFGSTLATEETYPEERWREVAAHRSEGDREATFVAASPDGTLVGLAGCFRETDDPGCAHLVSMWVAPEARRHGVARGLVDHAVEWARAAGAERVELWVTRGNDPALWLYEAAGFRPTGDHQPLPSDPCKDELRMRLTLDDR